MSGSSPRRGALLLALLMLFGGPIQTMMTDIASSPFDSNVLSDEDSILFAGAGDDAIIQLSGSGLYSDSFTVEVPSNAPVTDVHLSMKPSVDATHQGFVWDDNTVWSHSSAINNGTSTANGALNAEGGGVLWDFNTGLQGWTVSSSTFVSRWTSNSCGYNGSTGGSIKTQATSAQHATSPVVNLAGVTTMPLHAWVREGDSSCGEEPDANEDLQIQYKTSSGTWTTLNTFSAASYGPHTAQQWSANLPAAALHSTSQIRLNQISGSGSGATCCDFWFIDDVHLAVPPTADWTSPTIGFAASSFQDVEEGPWAPIHLNAEVPLGANLNWTVLDGSTGTPNTWNGWQWSRMDSIERNGLAICELNTSKFVFRTFSKWTDAHCPFCQRRRHLQCFSNLPVSL